jgi:hypothetical protein
MGADRLSSREFFDNRFLKELEESYTVNVRRRSAE